MGRGRSKSDRWLKLEALALRLAIRLLRLLGVDRASALMGFLWRHLGPYNKRHARADRHLRAALPHLAPDERRRILADMWENLGRTAAEGVLIAELIADRDRFVLADNLEQATAGARGVIFCSLHQGNWELAAWGGRLLGYSMAAVYRRLKNPWSEAIFKTLRQPIYDAGLMEAGGLSALRLRTLSRQGAGVAMLADLQDPTGLPMHFFGHESRIASFPAAMARRLDLTLVVARCRRTRGAHFHIEGHDVTVPRTDDAEADIRAATEAVNAQFERWIAERPEQWMWAIRKWPRQVLDRIAPPEA